MSRLSRAWIAVVLCLASLFNGLAVGATAPAEHAPCEMSAAADAGDSPCGGCDEPASLCAQQCAALGCGVLVARPGLSLSLAPPVANVAVGAAARFDSLAGPPGAQPPR